MSNKKILLTIGIIFILVILLLILLLILAINITSLLCEKTTTFKQIEVYHKAKNNLENILLDGWELKIDLIDIWIIEKIDKDRFEIYFEVEKEEYKEWTNDFVIVNGEGKIIRESLTESMLFYEIVYNQEGEPQLDDIVSLESLALGKGFYYIPPKNYSGNSYLPHLFLIPLLMVNGVLIVYYLNKNKKLKGD